MPLGYSCACLVSYRRTTSGSYSFLPPCGSLGFNSDHRAKPSGQTQGPLSGTWVRALNAAPQDAGSSVGLTTYLTCVPSDLCPPNLVCSLSEMWQIPLLASTNSIISLYITIMVCTTSFGPGDCQACPHSNAFISLTVPLPASLNQTPVGDRG